MGDDGGVQYWQPSGQMEEYENSKGINMNLIAAALVKAQKGFSPALKTSTNPHFKSKYADLSACVEAVIDSLNANGIALIQKCHESETGVTVETVFVHESGEIFEAGRLHVPAIKNDPQGYGSALTYARRYSLMAACGIAQEDDDGNAASNQPSLDVGKACAAIESAPTKAKAVQYAEAAMKRTSNKEEVARISNALNNWKDAA